MSEKNKENKEEKESKEVDLNAEIDKLKTELDTFRPFDNNTFKQLKEYYRISLTYTSNALEGNTLT